MKSNKALFIFGNMTTHIGNVLINFIISWWLIKITGNTKLLGIVLGAAVLPAIIINLLIGKSLDKYDKKKMMVICDLLSALVCMISFILIDTKFFIPVLICLVFLLFILNNIFSLSSKSIIKFLFDNNEIIGINSIFAFIKQFAKVIGPLIGSVLIIYISPKYFILINGVTFLISAIMEMQFKYVKELPKTSLSSRGNDKKERSISTLTIIKEQRLQKMLTFIMLNNFFMTAVIIFIPYLVIVVLKQESYLGLALAFESAGALSAVFLTKKVKSRFSYEAFALLASISLLLCNWNIVFICLGLFLYGLFLTMFNVVFSTDIQINTPDHLIGRVFSIIVSLGLILVPIGNFFFGMIGDILNSNCLLVIGILLTIVNIIFVVVKKMNKSEVVDSPITES